MIYIYALPHVHKQNYAAAATPNNVKQWGALRSPGQAVISSREIGSRDRKSRGRGKRGPIWEVQCKQSRFLIIPAHVWNWTLFDVLPQRPLRPPIPRSQTAALRASRGNVQIVAASDALGGGGQYLAGHWEGRRKNVKWCRVNWCSVNWPGVP